MPCSSTGADSPTISIWCPYRWDQSLSPGNEQSFYWGSASADVDGTRNYMGAKSPAIDAMIAQLLRRASATNSCPRSERSTGC